MSGYSEDDVKRAAEIREWLVKQISDRQDEVDKLRTTLALIDNLLKQGSFRAAATLGSFATAQTGVMQSQVQATRNPPKAEFVAGNEVRPLKRSKDDMLLANAEVSPNSVVIVPVQGIDLNIATPPFKSFFLSRILDGMKAKDVEKGIKESDSLNYQVEENGNGAIKKIVINNYRDKDRLNEIFNTSAWTFTRMLEKSGR